MIAESIFLLPNGTFFVELVAVVVILLIMTKYILPPLNKAMESRQEKIRLSLEAADEARAEAAAAADERAQVLAQARDQAREIVAAAQATADQVKAEAADAVRRSTTASCPRPSPR
jgi:F-type H+-transporting ATPase subunit b